MTYHRLELIANKGAALLLLALLCLPDVLFGQIVIDAQDKEGEEVEDSFYFPYYFRTDSMEDGFGLSYTSGVFSDSGKQSVAGYLTANNSWGLNAGLADYRIGKTRWLYDVGLGYEDNHEQRFYGDLAYLEGELGGGTHGSPADDFLAGPGISVRADALFSYALPIGDGRDNVRATYQTNGGFLAGPASGGSEWNPMKSGRTVITVKPFYQKRTMKITEDNIVQFPPVLGVLVGETVRHKTNGLTVGITYDNSDFALNPSRGSMQKITVTRDFGWFGSSEDWTSLEADFRKYINIGESDMFQQRVLALRAWTAMTPTFERRTVEDAIVLRGTGPSNMGAHLGGEDRLKAYPVGRFNDRAAIYYAAEVRLIPSWNGVKSWPIIRNTPFRWWQVTAFVETGRVAEEYDLGELHSDLNLSYGFGVGAMIGSQILRFTMATSDEATQAWFLTEKSF